MAGENIALKSHIVVKSKPKSTSKLWSIVDEYPCRLELSVVLKHVGKYKPSVSFKNVANDKTYGASLNQATNLLFGVDYEIENF